MDIDLVYLWVDGSDPKWKAKKEVRTGKLLGNEMNCDGRFTNNDELKYSLRSMEKNAPWLRKIFIVTDDQTPAWLDVSNPKVQIIDHKEIIPADCLPCFNSSVLEHYICKIPGLAEHFLYANDDMFINRPVSPETFFAKDGLPYLRLNKRPFRKLVLSLRKKGVGRPMSNHNKCVHNAAMLIKQKYGKYFSDKMHHNIDAYLKSSCQRTREMFNKEISETLHNHIRTPNDIQRHLYSYAALAEKRGHAYYVTQRTSFRFHIDNQTHYKKFKRYKPTFFCMNDSQYATNDDRKRVVKFLEKLFPEKSQFEK